MKKISIVAQFSPPVHGLSKAVDTLFNSNLKNKYLMRKVNLTNNKNFLFNFLKLLLSNDDMYYLTISQSKGGNIRDLIIIYLLKIKRKKVLIHLHGGFFRNMVENNLNIFQRKININLLNYVEGAIVLGPSLKYIFEGIVPSEKIYTVSNCVDDEYLGELDVIKKRFDYKELKVLFLSNFITDKGYMSVLHVAKMINEQKISNIKFILAGKFFKKEEELKFLKYIHDNNLNEIVQYNGVVVGEEKKELLRCCDVFILPTKYHKEGQPISILEAMANGQIIISTNHAGIPDIVENNVNGYLFNDISEEEIKNKLCLISNNKITYKDMAIKNYEKVNHYYTEKQYLSNLDKIFSTVIGN